MARTRQLQAICSDRVDSSVLSPASADRTPAAVSSRSGFAPILSVSGFTPSRYSVSVRSDRPDRPSASQSSTAFRTV